MHVIVDTILLFHDFSLLKLLLQSSYIYNSISLKPSQDSHHTYEAISPILSQIF